MQHKIVGAYGNSFGGKSEPFTLLAHILYMFINVMRRYCVSRAKNKHTHNADLSVLHQLETD
jgi:hypothetical protein